MVFSSNIFLFLFLPLFLVVYFFAGGVKARNFVLLVFSLFFYAWGELVFVFVLLLSVTINWRIAIYLEARSKFLLILGLAWNVGLLAVFKYIDFLIETTNYLAGTSMPLTNITLPLGLSFFSFQAMSYLVDVYRSDAKSTRNWFNAALYITMFPQLVAGPIVRYVSIANQIDNRTHTLMRVSIGVRVFIVGLAQKVLIANEVGRVADVAFSSVQALDFLEAWLGLSAYTLQIYFDFAGYSSMAIGIGLICGFSFPRNFRLPYTSQSITEFWRRWHISLSRWFRDYLYIPLGGNRLSSGRTAFNLILVFIICGLWHGAAFTFLAWGLFHGLFLLVERLWLSRVLRGLWAPVSWLYSLLVVMFGWVLFRAESLADVYVYYRVLFGFGGNGVFETPFVEAMIPTFYIAMLIGCIVALMPTHVLRAPIKFMSLPLSKIIPLQLYKALNAELTLRDTTALFLLVVSIIFVASGNYNPFLYFRF